MLLLMKNIEGKRLGEILLNAIVSHPKIIQIKHFELYCKNEMKPFYEKWGFTAKLPDLNFMRKSD